MAPKTDASGRIVREQHAIATSKEKTLAGMLSSSAMRDELAKALPKHITVDRIARIVLTALRVTPGLASTTPESFLGCVLQSAQLGLEVNTPLGHAYLIPRHNGRTGVPDCTLIIGYQGMRELAMRSGQVRGISAHVVRQGDTFEFELGLDPKLRHVPSDDPQREMRPITHAYAVARIKDADPVFEVLSKTQIDARAAINGGGKYGPWKTNYEAMARKSAVRSIFNWIPKSAEIAAAMHHEDVIERSAGVPSIGFTTEVQDALSSVGLTQLDAGRDEREIDPYTGEILPDGTGAAREPGADDEP